MTFIETAIKAIERIKELGENVTEVSVTLHIHREEEFRGMHTVSIHVQNNDRQKVISCFQIDLEGHTEDEAQEVYGAVFTFMKDAYPSTLKKRFIHREDEHWDE